MLNLLLSMFKDCLDLATLILMKISHFDRTALYLLASVINHSKKFICQAPKKRASSHSIGIWLLNISFKQYLNIAGHLWKPRTLHLVLKSSCKWLKRNFLTFNRRENNWRKYVRYLILALCQTCGFSIYHKCRNG